MSKTRADNAKRNMIYGLFNNLVMIFFPFLIKTVIVHKLGAEYLGLSSLFASILQVLNLTELGFSNAIVYCLYKPIAENDEKTICALLNYFKKIYRIVGSIIFAVGLLILPMVPRLIKGEYPSDINIYILYIIYLMNTVVSYILFAHKTSLVSAYQRNDVISKINILTQTIIYVTQIIILIYTNNYYFFAIIMFLGTILSNMATHLAANKLFPQIYCKGRISDQIKDRIKTNVKGVMITKLCWMSRNSFDSIFISAFLGLKETAIYNNYYLIMNSVIGILGIVINSITASIGDSVASETVEKNYEDMNRINFVYMWIAGWFVTTLMCLYQPFTQIVFGEDMLFPISIVALFCVYFYILKLGDVRATYNEVSGLWWHNRYRAIVESVLNIVLNYILGKNFGIYGILLATIISLFFVNFLWGATIVFKHYFKLYKVSYYFFLQGKYTFVALINCIIVYLVCCRFWPQYDLSVFIIRGIVSSILTNLFFYMVYRKTKIYQDSIRWLNYLFLKRNCK